MNYLGKKEKLNYFIYTSIKDFIENYENNFNNFLFADLFGGTGSVSKFWMEKGFNIIANDIQYYSYIKLNSILKNKKINKEKIIKIIDELNSICVKNNSKNNFITNNYSEFGKEKRKFFTIENAILIDLIRKKIESKFIKNELNLEEKYYLISILIDAASKVSNTAVVYEAYLKEYKKTALKKLKLKYVDFKKTNNKIFNEDINELIKKIKGDILYLDPPYNTRGYDTNYHILETISLYDKPKIINKSGRRNENNKKSKFVMKTTVEKEMKNLLENAKFKYIFISYSNEGILSEKKFLNIFIENNWDYKIFEMNYKRFKSNNNGKQNKDVTEKIYAIKKY